jgi:hypothetical protein
MRRRVLFRRGDARRAHRREHSLRSFRTCSRRLRFSPPLPHFRDARSLPECSRIERGRGRPLPERLPNQDRRPPCRRRRPCPRLCAPPLFWRGPAKLLACAITAGAPRRRTSLGFGGTCARTECDTRASWARLKSPRS